MRRGTGLEMGKEEGKQEEQKKGRLRGVKQQREETKSRRESEGRKNPGLCCEETGIPAATEFETTMERLEQKGSLSCLDFWLGLICIPKGPNFRGRKMFLSCR